MRLSYLYLTRFLVKREVDKPNGKTPGWKENFQETLKSQVAEGTADEESPLSSSGLVDAYKEDEESALDLSYPQPQVCFFLFVFFVNKMNEHNFFYQKVKKTCIFKAFGQNPCISSVLGTN